MISLIKWLLGLILTVAIVCYFERDIYEYLETLETKILKDKANASDRD